jgi:inner membrane protease subunit 1
MFARARASPRHHLFFHQHQPSSTLSRLHILRSGALPPLTRPFIIALKIFLAVHIVTSYIGSIGKTHGISMVPTIPHSYTTTPLILESRLHRRGRGIKVGDVITYTTPDNPKTMGCKRVIGMSGDFVSVVSVAREDEDLDKDNDEGDWANVKEEVIRVPEGHCWLAGDNLEWSRDSRVFGPVPLNLVKGKVLAVLWPLSDWKVLGGDEALKEPSEEGHEMVVRR